MSMLRKPFEANAIIHRVMAKTSFETAKLAGAVRMITKDSPLSATSQPILNQFPSNLQGMSTGTEATT